MKKIIIAISCLVVFSCASNRSKEDRIPAQTGNLGSFKTFNGTPLYNSCHLSLIDLSQQKIIHETDIATFENSSSVPVLDQENKVVGVAQKGKNWGTSSVCQSNRTSAKNVFRESKKSALDYCFKMNDTDSDDINGAYAEIYLVRLSLQKGIVPSTAPISYLNRDKPLVINGQGEGSVVVEDKYQLNAKCTLNNI